MIGITFCKYSKPDLILKKAGLFLSELLSQKTKEEILIGFCEKPIHINDHSERIIEKRTRDKNSQNFCKKTRMNFVRLTK